MSILIELNTIRDQKKKKQVTIVIIVHKYEILHGEMAKRKTYVVIWEQRAPFT